MGTNEDKTDADSAEDEIRHDDNEVQKRDTGEIQRQPNQEGYMGQDSMMQKIL